MGREEEETIESENVQQQQQQHEDPYAFILANSHISFSQEQLLQINPFVGETQNSTQHDMASQNDADLPVASAPILMVTPPDSQDGPQDVFHTPPEEASLASSDDQRCTLAVDVDFDQCLVNQAVDVDAGSQVFVDLGGFSDGSETVELGKDSGLGFSETQFKQEIDAKLVPAGCAEGDGLGEIRKGHLDEFEVLEREISDLGDSPVKKLKLSEQNLGEAEEGMGNCLGVEQEPVDSGNENDSCREISVDKNLGKEKKFETEVDQLKSVTSARDVNMIEGNKESDEIAEGSGMRVLPISISSDSKNAANEKEPSEGEKKKKFDVFSLLKALAENSSGVKGYEDEGISLFEAAKQSGVTFPRPRWWPDSFDDNGQIKKAP